MSNENATEFQIVNSANHIVGIYRVGFNYRDGNAEDSANATLKDLRELFPEDTFTLRTM